jgi:WD40 repeat protein
MVNLSGPVRVAEKAGSGKATITLSFAAWEDGKVHSTTHTLTVLPPRPKPKEEAVATSLIATLNHPDAKADVLQLAFSPDSKRLFASGYPSGVVQFWDVESAKELHRMKTPESHRQTSEYALLAPDWKTLYVPVEGEKFKRIEREGKKGWRREYDGKFRVWDVDSGKEKDPLRTSDDTTPVHAVLSPDGKYLVYVERTGWDNFGTKSKDVTMVRDVTTGKTWKLHDDFVAPDFAPDGKTVAVLVNNEETNDSVLKLLDLATGKELVQTQCPDKERLFGPYRFSPDGALLSVFLDGKIGTPLEVRFLDAKSLEERGKLIGKGNPDGYGYGWGRGRFTPDGKSFISLDGVGNVLVWDLKERKIKHTLPIGNERAAWTFAISPDSKTAAVPWRPKADEETERETQPDPRDLPQPRVALIDLTGDAPPRVLIAPQGDLGALAFSPDGKKLAFGSTGTVHVFDLRK